MQMQDTEIVLKDYFCTKDESLYVQEESFFSEETDQISKILDAKYQPADLKKITDELGHLDDNQKARLKDTLSKRSSLFDGTLGQWKSSRYHIELKDDAKPYHARPYSIPQAYKHAFKNEVQRLCEVGVLRKINRSEWAAPTFLIPKKYRTVRFISNFRE